MMKPLAWQPGTATFWALATRSRWPPLSSGRPYTQSGLVRWAVEASRKRVLVLPGASRATDSREAASGRQRKTTSALLMYSALTAGSLRLSSGMVRISISGRMESRSSILRPVVPWRPSMNTLKVMANSVCVRSVLRIKPLL